MKPILKKTLLIFFSFLLGGLIFTGCSGNNVTSSESPSIELENSSESEQHVCKFEVVEKKGSYLFFRWIYSLRVS